MDSESLPISTFTMPGTNYGYKALGIDALAARMAQATNVIGVLDESTSTGPYKQEMETCCELIVEALKEDDTADNLIYRQVHFSTGYREEHPFLPIINIDPSRYKGCYRSHGRTELYDSLVRAATELLDFSKRQVEQKMFCNGALYCLTDGCDYGSILTPKKVKEAFSDLVSDEDLESIVTVMIGINPDDGIQAALKDFADEVGFTRYMPVKDATKETLRRVAKLVSKSVSLQSQALGSGGPSHQIASLKF